MTKKPVSLQDEGYVKYRAERENIPLPEFSLFEEINKTRTELFKKGLIGIYPNGIGFGNISIRFRDNSFIISGTATGADQSLSKDQYCLVKTCDPKNNTVFTQGMIDASSESMSHGIIYSTTKDINSVIHIHSRPLFDIMLSKDYPKTAADIPYGTPEMAFAIADLIKKTNQTKGIFVMAGHEEGIIAYGKDLSTAYNLIVKIFETNFENK